MNYELFMGEALAEAKLALSKGERPVAAVAVVDEAMVARAHDRVRETNDPTAHAVVVALREAARKLGRIRLADATIFATHEPCPMCVGALLQSDVEALVFAMPNELPAYTIPVSLFPWQVLESRVGWACSLTEMPCPSFVRHWFALAVPEAVPK